MGEKQHLQQSLLATSNNSSSNHDIVLRLLFTFSMGSIALWANHEYSKGIEVHVLNNHDKSSPAGRRFNLFYLSNDEATRLVLQANDDLATKSILSSSTNTTHRMAPISRVIVQMASHDLDGHDYIVHVVASGEFVLSLSPSLMQGSEFKFRVRRAVQRGVAEMWQLQTNGALLTENLAEYVAL